ncbi:MAG: pyrroline-5-carboxylate reductase [Pirellulales bacterium]|nr:pyrroline-5-carboxylate reductase [Pirellulales bacterium]
MLSEKIGFIGAGQMATALAKGFVAAGLVGSENLLAADTSSDALANFSTATGAKPCGGNRQLAEMADVVFLAVKPQNLSEVLPEIAGVLSDTLVISIAAGVKLGTLAAGLGEDVRLVRVMPNTPCLVGQGASGYCLGEKATPDDGLLAKQLLEASGVAYEVPEKLLDAVTGLSGSGPAFVYIMIEALSDGGVRMGLPRQIASSLAAQTVRGAAEVFIQTGQHPGQLKDNVTSPGGTTIAGIHALESGGIRAALITAVQAATERSIELGKQ